MEIIQQKKALADYLIDSKQETKFPKPTINVYRAALPFLGMRVSKWARVKPKKFRQNDHRAYERLCDTWKNLLNSKTELKSIIGEVKTDADAQESSSSDSDYDSQNDA